MASVVREHSLKRRGKKLPCCQLVLLCEHNNSISVDESFGIGIYERAEKRDLLEHPVLGVVFKKDSIVTRHVTCEDNSIHVLECVDPFLPLAPQASMIEELVDSAVMNELCLVYTSGLPSEVKYVLDGGNIVWIQDAIHRFPKTSFLLANTC